MDKYRVTVVKSLQRQIERSFVTGSLDVVSISYYSLITKYIDFAKSRKEVDPSFESKFLKLQALEKKVKFTCKSICNVKVRTINS